MLSDIRKLCAIGLVLFVVSCSKPAANTKTLPPISATPLSPTEISQPPAATPLGGTGSVERALLRFNDLMNGFDFEFVQREGYLIPVQRGLIIADHPTWNLILEPGRVWQEAGDGGYSRASLPFALTVKGGNAAFNGTLTFLFDKQRVSKVWYQVTQEITNYTRANLWGLLDAA